MRFISIWNIDRPKSSGNLSESSEQDLRSYFRNGDNRAGSELLRRQRLGRTDLDKLLSEGQEQKLFSELEQEVAENERILNAQ